MNARLYALRTARTPFGFYVWCSQHRAVAVHVDREIAVGTVVLAIMFSNLTHRVRAPLVFSVEDGVDYA